MCQCFGLICSFADCWLLNKRRSIALCLFASHMPHTVRETKRRHDKAARGAIQASRVCSVLSSSTFATLTFTCSFYLNSPSWLAPHSQHTLERFVVIIAWASHFGAKVLREIFEFRGNISWDFEVFFCSLNSLPCGKCVTKKISSLSTMIYDLCEDFLETLELSRKMNHISLQSY